MVGWKDNLSAWLLFMMYFCSEITLAGTKRYVLPREILYWSGPGSLPVWMLAVMSAFREVHVNNSWEARLILPFKNCLGSGGRPYMLEEKQFEKYKLKDDLFGKISGSEALKGWARYSARVNGNGFVWPHCNSRKSWQNHCALLCTPKRIRHLEAYRKFYV